MKEKTIIKTLKVEP